MRVLIVPGVVILTLVGLVLWLYVRVSRWAERCPRARPLHFEDAPRVHRLVERLSRAARLPRPRLYVLEHPRPDASSLGTSARGGAIVLTSAALRELDDWHLQALLAHEVAHLAHGHTLRSTLAMAAADALLGAARRLGRLGAPHARDLAADRTAAALCGNPAVLAAALERLAERLPHEAEPLSTAMGSPFMGSTVGVRGRAPLAERVARLRELASEERARHRRGLRLRPTHHLVRRTRFFLRRGRRAGRRPRPAVGAGWQRRRPAARISSSPPSG
jgi:heat shock protein HtpX